MLRYRGDNINTVYSSFIQFGELVGLAAADSALPVGDVLGGGAAIMTYRRVVDPWENALGRVSMAFTLISDVLDGYTGLDRHGSKDSSDWEIVIGQNVVEDLGYALAGETTRFVPVGLIDFGINSHAMLDDFGDILGNPDWELRLTYGSDLYYVYYDDDGKEIDRIRIPYEELEPGRILSNIGNNLRGRVE